MSIIKQRKIWFTISGTLVVVSAFAFAIWGLNLGIDFTGGSLLEIEFNIPRPDNQQIKSSLTELNLGDVTVQTSDEKGVILRFREIDEKTHQDVISTLNRKFGQEITPEGEMNLLVNILEEKRFDSIGPTIGQELRRKTIWTIGIVAIVIILYIAWAFRKVSKPIASWKYGLIAVVALIHDILITVGIFVALGKFYGLEVNVPFVVALLTILGYSVNDTIVVFDRTRENLIRHLGENFEEIVQLSIDQVITRSINTSLTTLLTLFSILLFGGATLRDFVLALIVGISVGTYSSIFLASPLLVVWEKIRSDS